MAIIYDPAKLLQKIAPESKVKKLIDSRASLKKTALSFTDALPENIAGVIDKKQVKDVALKVVKGYKERIAEDKSIKKDLVKDPALLVQRVQNEVLLQVRDAVVVRYAGEFYEWLPSSSSEPDPEHQLLYGQTFQVGVGEMPQDRYGCKCGMRILVDETKLDL